MADKMMRIAGRGEDGLAKAVKTDNEGVLQQRGQNSIAYSNYERTEIKVGESLKLQFNTTSPYLELNVRFEASSKYTVRQVSFERQASVSDFYLADTTIFNGINLYGSHMISTTGNRQEVHIKNTGTTPIYVLACVCREIETDKSRFPVAKNRFEAVPFGGTTSPTFSTVNPIVSGLIDVSKMEDLNVYVANTTGVKVWLNVIFETENGQYNSMFYDWNTDTWKQTYLKVNAIELASASGAIYNLGSHPDMYWLKDLHVKAIRLRFVPEAVSTTGQLRVWLGGKERNE